MPGGHHAVDHGAHSESPRRGDREMGRIKIMAVNSPIWCWWLYTCMTINSQEAQQGPKLLKAKVKSSKREIVTYKGSSIYYHQSSHQKLWICISPLSSSLQNDERKITVHRESLFSKTVLQKVEAENFQVNKIWGRWWLLELPSRPAGEVKGQQTIGPRRHRQKWRLQSKGKHMGR